MTLVQVAPVGAVWAITTWFMKLVFKTAPEGTGGIAACCA
jgi:hypothetical protein